VGKSNLKLKTSFRFCINLIIHSEKIQNFLILINKRRLKANQAIILSNNRGYTYGDALFETIKVLNGKLLFWEDHYFRLMSSMRILRMEIPSDFTMEFIEDQIIKQVKSLGVLNAPIRVRLMVNRVEGGLYLPFNNSINYMISSKIIARTTNNIKNDQYEVDVFKDFYVSPGLLSTLKTNNRIINVLGSVYAKENSLKNCILLNSDKKVVEALNGNIFLVKDNTIRTPPILDGCIKGIMRKQIIKLIEESDEYNISVDSISPYELQKADELFITNIIEGIKSITKFRKKTYNTIIAEDFFNRINLKINTISCM